MSKQETNVITYTFATGTVTKIDLTKIPAGQMEIEPERLMAEIREMERLERNCNQRERRRSQSFQKAYDATLIRIGANRIVPPSDPTFLEVIRNDQYAKLHRAIEKLLPEQQELITKIYFLKIPAVEIAKHEGVGKSAISHRVKRALAQLEKNLTA